ncbi:MAG TPA: DUF2934 domain-containing protein [Rhodospirillales bacterium]|nr:DUF2934 domain-containing protein [Rhodospirillales bacterium]
MDPQMEIRIRSLAHPLWESAARPYGMALDFWLMAEQMILEMLTASARLATTAAGETIVAAGGGDRATAPINRVQDLAHCMWENAGRQYELALDCWLAAEKHAVALSRAAAVAREGATELAALPAPAYLEHIRRNAYYLWDSAGRQYGNALGYWLQAERQVLNAMTEAAAANADVPPTPSPEPQRSEGAATT